MLNPRPMTKTETQQFLERGQAKFEGYEKGMDTGIKLGFGAGVLFMFTIAGCCYFFEREKPFINMRARLTFYSMIFLGGLFLAFSLMRWISPANFEMLW